MAASSRGLEHRLEGYHAGIRSDEQVRLSTLHGCRCAHSPATAEGCPGHHVASELQEASSAAPAAVAVSGVCCTGRTLATCVRRAIPVHSEDGEASTPKPLEEAVTPTEVARALEVAALPSAPVDHKCHALETVRQAVSLGVLKPEEWLRSSVLDVVSSFFTTADSVATATALQRHRHLCLWILSELASVEGGGLVDRIVEALGPTMIALVDASDTVLAQLAAHSLANCLATASEDTVLALARMGVCGALVRNLQRQPAQVSSTCMWGVEYLLQARYLPHSSFIAEVLGGVEFWAGRTLSRVGAATEVPTVTIGGDAKGQSQRACVEAGHLFRVVCRFSLEGWALLFTPTSAVLAAVCKVVSHPSIASSIKAPFLDGLAALSGTIDVGPLLLSQAGFGEALVALAKEGTLESDDIVGVTATTVPGLALVLLSNLVAPPSDLIEREWSTRRDAISASGLDPSSLPPLDTLLVPAVTKCPTLPPHLLDPVSVARSLLDAGVGEICTKWLQSHWKMRNEALNCLWAMAVAGKERPPVFLGRVAAYPGVLKGFLGEVSETNSVEVVGRSLKFLEECFLHVPGSLETFEELGGRDVLDSLLYSSKCSRPAGDGWEYLSRKLRWMIDEFLESDTAIDDDEDDRLAPNPFAASSMGRGRTMTMPAWATSGSVPGASSSPSFG
jgi:hypothetical protein